MFNEQEMNRMVLSNRKKISFTYEKQQLDLSNCGLGDDNIKDIAEIIRISPAVTHLNLANNKISGEGLEALAEVLKKNSSLTHLNLANNIIKHTKTIEKIIKKSKSLKWLNLESNLINIRGACGIFDALQSNESLTHLGLAKNHIMLARTIKSSISSMSRKNKTLTVLNLEKNSSNIKYLTDIIKVIAEENKSLTRFMIHECLSPQEEYEMKYNDIFSSNNESTSISNSWLFSKLAIMAFTVASFFGIQRHPESGNPINLDSLLCKTGIPHLDRKLNKKFLYLLDLANKFLPLYYIEEGEYKELSDDKKVESFSENIHSIKYVNHAMQNPFVYAYSQLPPEMREIVATYTSGIELTQKKKKQAWDVITKKIENLQNPSKSMIFTKLDKQDKGKEKDKDEYTLESNNKPKSMKMGLI